MSRSYYDQVFIVLFISILYITQCLRITSPPAQWVDNRGDLLNQLLDQELDQLKIVSYNTLGPWHGESSKHSYAPVSVTKWTRRRDKVLYEIEKTNPDIVCLQEVSYKSLKETFVPGMRYLGLELATYASNKPSNERGRGTHGHKQIGCATFISKTKCKLISARNVHLRDYANLDNSASSSFRWDVRQKHNSMALVCVEILATKQPIIIVSSLLPSLQQLCSIIILFFLSYPYRVILTCFGILVELISRRCRWPPRWRPCTASLTTSLRYAVVHLVYVVHVCLILLITFSIYMTNICYVIHNKLIYVLFCSGNCWEQDWYSQTDCTCSLY